MSDHPQVIDTPPVGKKPKLVKQDKVFKLMGIDGTTPTGSTKAQRMLGMNANSPQELRGIKKKVDKFDKTQHEREVAAAKERVLYEDRLSRSQLTLKELRRTTPVSDKTVAEFEKVHAEAKILADQSEWAKASKALHKVHLTDALTKANEAWSNAQKVGEKAAPIAFELSKEILIIVRNKDVLLPLEVRRKYDTSVTALMRPLLAAKPGKDEVTMATQGMQLLRETLDLNLQQTIEDRNNALTLTNEATRVLDAIAPVTPAPLPLLTDREAAVLREQQRVAQTAFDSIDFKTVVEILTPLIADGLEAKTRMEGLRNQWLAVASQVSALVGRATTLENTAQSPEITGEAYTLKQSLAEIATLGVGKGVTYPDAIDRVSGADTTLIRLEAADAEWWRFRVGDEQGAPGEQVVLPQNLPIQQAQDRVAEQIEMANEAIANLQLAIADLVGDDYDELPDAGFDDRLGDIEDAWNKRAATASSVEALDEKSTSDALDKLIDDVVKATVNDKVLGGLASKARDGAARQKYDEANALAQRRVESLLAADPLAGSDAIDALEAIAARAGKAKSEGDLIKATSEVQRLGVEAERQAVALHDSIEEAQEQLQTILEGIATALTDFMIHIKKVTTGAKQTPLLALHATLLSTYDGLRALLNATQLGVLTEALADANAFTKETENSIKAAKGQPITDGDSVMSFDGIRRAIADYKEDLAGKDIKMFGIVTASEIEEKIKAVEDGLGGKTMSALTKDVAEIGTDIEKLETKVAKSKELFTAFKEGVDNVRAKLENPGFAEFPSFIAAMNKRLDAAIADGRFEGGITAARNVAVKIGIEIDAALASPKNERGEPTILADKEKEAVDAARKLELDKAKFEGECEVVKKRLERVSGIEDRELSSLQDTLTEAKKAVKTAEKSGNADYSTGRDQLASILKRLGLLEANPAGLAITSRNKLPQVCEKVKRHITQLNDGLAEFGSTIDNLPEADLDAPSKVIVRKQAVGVRALFNATVFDKPIAKVADRTTKDADRSAAREVALREMRRMLALMENDYRLMALPKNNPFHTTMASLVSGLMLALLDLENNLLVSM